MAALARRPARRRVLSDRSPRTRADAHRQATQSRWPASPVDPSLPSVRQTKSSESWIAVGPFEPPFVVRSRRGRIKDSTLRLIARTTRPARHRTTVRSNHDSHKTPERSTGCAAAPPLPSARIAPSPDSAAVSFRSELAAPRSKVHASTRSWSCDPIATHFKTTQPRKTCSAGRLRLSNAIRGVDAGLRDLFFEHQIAIKVGHRPDRNEPRANNRRPKILQLLTKPRHKARAELEPVA